MGTKMMTEIAYSWETLVFRVSLLRNTYEGMVVVSR